MTHTTEQLTRALQAAKEAAEEFASSEDGGTCNFDTAVFPLKQVGRKRLAAAEEASGVSCYVQRWFGQQCVFVCIGSGQANRRTRMAEAAAKALKARGLEATVYYQMD